MKLGTDNIRNHRAGLILVVMVCAFCSIAWLDSYRDTVDSGNEEYQQKKYNNAKRYYQKAEQYAPGEEDKKKLSFNDADADFMLENYDSAVSSFQRAMQSEDREVQKKAFFNAGNTYLKQGNYREAVNAYINALKIDPNYDKAKKNLEYLLNQKKNQKDQKNNQNDNKDKDKNKNKNKNDKDKSPQDNKDQNKNQDQNKQQAGDRQQNQGNKMNREQIKNILRSMQQSPIQRKKGSPNERRKLDKNW